MSNKRAPAVRKATGADPRVERSTRALGRALTALLATRDFDSITVQQVLDEAGVGRATFYAHFRNKVDVLHSSYEGALLWFDERLRAEGPGRLFPVAEFLEHMSDAGPLVSSLRRSGRMEPMRQLFVAQAGRTIEGRLQAPPDAGQRRLVAQMLAGALAEAVEWWDAHRERATPAQVDRAFHALAANLTTRQQNP